MKSMTPIQNGLIAKADFTGGYPRIVHVGLGIVALAHDKKEFDRLQHSSLTGAIIFGGGLFAVLLGAIGCVIYVAATA
jgi:hypothetical protein